MLEDESKQRKKILLLTVTAGEGHNSAMKTLKAKFEAEGNEVKVVDVFRDHGSAFKHFMISKAFLTLCKYFMPLYNLGFKMCRAKDPSKRDRFGVHGFLKKETASFLQDIIQYKPDVIFATHIYGAIMALDLKRTYALPYKVVFLFTDCVIYPYAECGIYVDKVITPYDALKVNYLQLGYSEDQILPYGIPVKEKFYQKLTVTKAALRKQLGLDENLFTVMLMLGGGGSSDMVRIFKETIKVKKPIQILVICGKDAKSKRHIDKYLARHILLHKVVNYGFVGNIEDLMAASDLLLGKCGGLSSTEAICRCLPLMVTTKLPIQEEANYQFLLKHNAVLQLRKGEKVATRIEECIANPLILKEVVNNLAGLKNCDILENIYKAVDKLGTVEYGTKFDYLLAYPKSRVKKDVRKMLKTKHKD